MLTEGMNGFAQLKKHKLESDDLSRKGSIDEPIKDLVDFINERNAYVTSSSCSGRVIVISQDGSQSVQKKGCQWILSLHSTITPQQLEECLAAGVPNAVLKFEPFILHVLCERLEDAQTMHLAAIESGFRNSGLSIGKKGKIMLAVRSTHGLEVPLTGSDGTVMVDSAYLDFVAQKANQKMLENQKRINRLFELLKEIFRTLPNIEMLT